MMVNVDHPLRFMVECFMLMVNSLFYLILMVNFDSSTFLVGAQSSGLGAYHPPSHPGQDFEKLLSDQATSGARDGQGARITHAICCPSKQLGFVAGTGP